MTAPAESASQAFLTSAYSLKALAAAVAPLMPRGAGIVGLDFDASVAWPMYDWMGVAKAALESVSRYLARDLGPAGVRVNLVSAGPLGTVAAQGIPGFEQLADLWRQQAPLGLGHLRPRPGGTRASAGCCRTTPRRSAARSCMSMGDSTPWGRRRSCEPGIRLRIPYGGGLRRAVAASGSHAVGSPIRSWFASPRAGRGAPRGVM